MDIEKGMGGTVTNCAMLPYVYQIRCERIMVHDWHVLMVVLYTIVHRSCGKWAFMFLADPVLWDVMDVGLAHYGMVQYHTICYDTPLEKNSLSAIDYTIQQSVCCVSHADRCHLLIGVSYMVYGTVWYQSKNKKQHYHYNATLAHE
jgi:hypothetical protein